jgi:hypothetical protein
VGVAFFHKVKRIFCRTRPRDIEPHCWANINSRSPRAIPLPLSP